jgi:hypothetical protein
VVPGPLGYVFLRSAKEIIQLLRKHPAQHCTAQAPRALQEIRTPDPQTYSLGSGIEIIEVSDASGRGPDRQQFAEVWLKIASETHRPSCDQNYLAERASSRAQALSALLSAKDYPRIGLGGRRQNLVSSPPAKNIAPNLDHVA